MRRHFALIFLLASAPGCSSCKKGDDRGAGGETPSRHLAVGPSTGELAPGTVAAGDLFACAITPTRKVVCWGENAMGQLGSSGPSSHDTPRVVDGVDDVVQLTAQGRHACARRRDGAVHCWGENNRGQTGHAPSLGAKPEAAVAIGGSASDLSTAAYETCAVTAETLSCWGDATRTHEPEHLFVWPDESSRVRAVVAPAGLVRVATAARHVCVLTAAGDVSCRGDNDDGRLDGARGPGSETFLRVPVPGPARDIGAGDIHSCALLRSGEVHCWGGNGRGELGAAARADGSIGRVRLAGVAQALSIGSDHSCALLVDGAVQCWGWNSYQQIGAKDPDTTALTTVPGLPSDVVAIACGGMLSCARARSGTVHCWGATSADDMFRPAEKKAVRRISGT